MGRIKSEELAPVDSISVIDRKEFEDRLSGIEETFSKEIGWQGKYLETEINKIKDKTKTLAIVGGIITMALCFVIAVRKD